MRPRRSWSFATFCCAADRRPRAPRAHEHQRIGRAHSLGERARHRGDGRGLPASPVAHRGRGRRVQHQREDESAAADGRGRRGAAGGARATGRSTSSRPITPRTTTTRRSVSSPMRRTGSSGSRRRSAVDRDDARRPGHPRLCATLVDRMSVAPARIFPSPRWFARAGKPGRRHRVRPGARVGGRSDAVPVQGP